MSKVEREDFLMEDTRIKVVCSDRVCDIVQRALERYYEKYLSEDLTSEFLLFILMEDEESLISRYMYNEELFSCYIREEELENCKPGEDEEDYCWMTLLSKIEEEIDMLETEYYVNYDKNSITNSCGKVLLKAGEIAKELKRSIVDEEVLTIALVQCNNPIWEMLEICDVEDIADGMLLSHFCEDNLSKSGFLEAPIECEYGYN